MDEENKKKNKKTLIISIIIILIAIIAGAIIGVIYEKVLSRTELDLSKYVSIESEGFDGYASFDENDLVIDTKGLRKLLDSKKLANKLEKKLLNKAKVTENKNLKNGDEIKVKFKLSESWLKENKLKLKSNTIKIKVTNLEEPNSIDLFEDLEFSYSGISPNLTVYLENNSKDDFIKYNVTFTMQKNDDTDETGYYSLSDIANGDKIIVTADFDQSDLEKAGYIIDTDKNTYSFVVKDQAEYIADAKDLTSDIQKEIETQLLEKAKNIANNSDYDVTYAYHEDFSDAGYYDWKFTHTDPELAKMYIAINNDMSNVGWTDSRNMVYAIYKSTFTDTSTSKTYDFYIPVYVEDLIIESKKLSSEETYYYEEYYSYNNEDVFHKSSDELYKVFENETKGNYKITEIK